MKGKKIKRIAILVILLAFVMCISSAIVVYTNFAELSFFSFGYLFTYFGVLIGFALTIYTFGISMVDQIVAGIHGIENLSQDQKSNTISVLISGFREIKENIWLMCFGMLCIVCAFISSEFESPYVWPKFAYKIPDIINVSFFILSTIAMFDLTKTLFRLSEIKLTLVEEQN